MIIYDLNFMQIKKKYIWDFFWYYIIYIKTSKFGNILTFSKAFDSIPDFENLGYQIEIVNLFKNFA